MAFESVNYQCPACGGPLHFASAEQKLVCDYCDSRFEVEEVEALYRERQDKADAKADAAAAAPKPAADDAVQELAQNAGYICSSCGAELVSDGTVAVTTCPYCGNSAVAPGQLSGDFSPDLVIPFKLGRDDVTAALKEHYKGKILLPKSFVTGNHIDEVQGVYVPFWLYGARVDGEVYFDATNETVTEESDRTVTTTDHYDAYRKGNISFKRVPVDGSSKMPDGHMDAIEPFDYDALRPFSVAYMPGYIANRYDEDCETCKARAERRMEESTISALRETVVDEYDDATVESKQLDYTWEDSDYALFPVWMLSTSWNGKSYLFAMNGQTGRLVGELPCSKPKLAIASVLFFVIGFILSQILFMGENAFDPDYLAFDIEGILINIVAPLIIDYRRRATGRPAQDGQRGHPRRRVLRRARPDREARHLQPHRDHRCHERRQGRLSNPTNTTRPLTRKEDHHGTLESWIGSCRRRHGRPVEGIYLLRIDAC